MKDTKPSMSLIPIGEVDGEVIKILEYAIKEAKQSNWRYVAVLGYSPGEAFVLSTAAKNVSQIIGAIEKLKFELLSRLSSE